MLSTDEYKAIKLRQEAIIIDMEGVARAVQKVNNSAGKQALAEIVSGVLQGFNIPFVMPSKFGYAVLGFWGIIPQQREFNKLKKYYARLEELRKEFDFNRLKLAEFEIEAITPTGIDDKDTLTNPNIFGIDTQNGVDGVVNSLVRSAKSLSPFTVLGVVAGGLFVRKVWKSKNKKRR